MDQLSQSAWEPVTPNGVATFAHAKISRLLMVQLVVALIAAGCVCWTLYDGYFPVVRKAIDRMPDEGQIRWSKLNWPAGAPQVLSEGRMLAISVDLDGSTSLRSPSHVQVELGRDSFFIHSLFGYAEIDYPEGWIIAFNRTELQPRLGAWQWPSLAIVGAGMVVFLFGSWAMLATLYAGPITLIGFYTNRDLNLRASWKLSAAALMPGALAMSAGILFYDFGAIDLVHLMFVFAGHLILGWIYLWLSFLFLPRHPAAQRRKNPFASR